MAGSKKSPRSRRGRRHPATLAAINRLSKQWRPGIFVHDLARQWHMPEKKLWALIYHARRRYPRKFPERSLKVIAARLHAERRPDIEQLSNRWKAGASLRELARDWKLTEEWLWISIMLARRRY